MFFRNSSTNTNIWPLELIYGVYMIPPANVCSNRHWCNIYFAAMSIAAYISWREHIYTIDELKGSNIGNGRWIYENIVE